ncbi:AraC family transcriptional regulator [Marinobacterium litorale]|uniref:AraC family transcriptional regulator n=1 Tax=Marinobacterium litorale TaxID=404770 RepID=UPI000406CE67|nr:AraC family transcriptional regulator [Marinobacterium litorale]
MLNNVLNNASVFEGAHPLQVSEYVNQHVGRHRIRLNGGSESKGPSTNARLSYTDFADLGLSRISYGDAVTVSCPDLAEVYHFQVVTHGECYWHYADDQRLRLRTGQALMMNPKEQIDLSYSPDCEKVIIKVPEQVLISQCIEQVGVLPKSGIRFARRAIDLDSSVCLLRFLDALLTEASESELELESLQIPYRDILLNKLLQHFDSNFKDNASGGISDRGFAELIAFIDMNLKAELEVEELARMSNVSVRTVYNLFAKHFGLTPRLYIKNAKLRALRNELVGNTRLRNVTEVALDYGFSHLGRFSSDYRKMFGELPSETFRRHH